MSTTPSFVLTYDSLTSTVLQYLERKDPAVVNFIPVAISLSEFEIAQEIKTLGQLTIVNATVQAGNPVVAKPARWRKTVSFNVTDTSGNQEPVLLRKYEYLINYNIGATSGLPLYYADIDWEHWLIAPVPDQAYNFQVLYYSRLQPLSSDNQTNWLTQNAPNVMLYGTLLQCMPFLKNDQRQIFQQKYTEALTALKTEDQLRLGDRQTIAEDA